MVYLYYISCLRYTILAVNPRYETNTFRIFKGTRVAHGTDTGKTVRNFNLLAKSLDLARQDRIPKSEEGRSCDAFNRNWSGMSISLAGRKNTLNFE